MSGSADVFSPMLVLGMHRSGTSATAGLLSAMGIPPARWCAESRSNDVNPKGFFEPRPLVWENERLLNRLDSSWMHPPAQSWDIDWSPTISDSSRRSARRLRLCARADPWFWKDPRLCLLMPYWERLGVTFRDIVFVTRNPADVGRSLRARNDIAERGAMDLWFTYMKAAAKHCEGREVFMIDYDEFFAPETTAADDLRAWLGARGWRPRGSAPRGTVDPALRRSDGAPACGKHPAIGLYNELRSLGSGPVVVDRPTTALDRELISRLHMRRDTARGSWEQGQRRDRRALKTASRTLRILPGALREVTPRRRNAVSTQPTAGPARRSAGAQIVVSPEEQPPFEERGPR